MARLGFRRGDASEGEIQSRRYYLGLCQHRVSDSFSVMQRDVRVHALLQDARKQAVNYFKQRLRMIEGNRVIVTPLASWLADAKNKGKTPDSEGLKVDTDWCNGKLQQVVKRFEHAEGVSLTHAAAP